MKKFLLTLLIVSLMSIAAFSQDVPHDSLLIVSKTNVAPIIDGDVDAVWRGVQYYPATVMVDNETYTENWYDWFDTFVGIRLMYDDSKLYMLYDIWDDLIPGENYDVANHEYDSMEIYLDGDNSKTEGAYDTIDDIQFRFIYMYQDMGFEEGTMPQYGFGADGAWDGDDSITDLLHEGTQFAWSDKENFSGARLEVALDLVEYRLLPAVGEKFGFDIQYNDNDEAGIGPRVNEWKWWSNSGDSWRDASKFGTAEWDDYVADEFLNVPMATSAPVIDGELDEAWENMPVFSCDVFVTQTTQNGESEPFTVNGEPFLDNIFFYMLDWTDCWPTFRAMWDEENFYLFLNVEDDIIFTEGNAWEADCLELYFDGDHSKNDAETGYDDNDKQLRWVADNVSIQANTEAVSALTATGWTYEIKIPFSELGFTPELGANFGFEVQIADNDGEEWNREGLMRWWSDDNNSWQDASLFGDAYFGDVVGTVDPTAVAQDVTVAEEFDLTQNYPNPFNPTTTIDFAVPQTGNVQLVVYDMLGKEIATLVNDVRTAGQYSVTFDGANLSSGVYFYTLKAGDVVETNKMMLVK